MPGGRYSAPPGTDSSEWYRALPPAMVYMEAMMTSGIFHSVPVDSIVVNRETRQRRDVSDVGDLVDSIRRLGLINPITITRDHLLVAGERRLLAIKKIGWTHVAAQYLDEINDFDVRSIELEENIKRKELPWQDECLAILDYHNHRRSANPEWSQNDTAKAIGFHEAMVSRKINVANEIVQGNERVIEAPIFSTARGIVERKKQRQEEQAIEIIKIQSSSKAEESHREIDSIITANFNEWAPTYLGPLFNFVHCDFPYGIGADKFAQGSAALHGGYSDTEADYWNLCRTLADNLDKLCYESCHFVFWFSLANYSSTLEFFQSNTDIVLDPYPLVWYKSDNVGILPDPERGPRRVYETAFFGQRGDRRIVRAKCNAYAAPTVRDVHMSIKPEPMLRYFFEMFVDESTSFLDPTCGSGSALRAAESLGASHVLGLELNAEFAEEANRAQKRMRVFIRRRKMEEKQV